MPDSFDRYWAVLPAGGSGTRMGAPLPKQYLELGGVTMLERSVQAMLAAAWLDRLIVVVAPDDARAQPLFAAERRVEVLKQGGATRRDSVLAGLRHLQEHLGAQSADWVLVHDAARPGLSLRSLDGLRSTLAGSAVGGLLALPVADTVKRAQAGGATALVESTVDRTGLWLAQTPQMFRLGVLTQALEHHAKVTDEASAIEAAGHAVMLVEGERMNFKVTTPDDLDWMRRLLGEAR